MGVYRHKGEDDPGYAVQGWSRKCVLPGPPSGGGGGGGGGGGTELGWFSMGSWGDTQESMPPPAGVVTASTTEYRYKGTSLDNRLSEKNGGVWSNNPNFIVGLPWPSTGFTEDSAPGVTEFSLWWWWWDPS